MSEGRESANELKLKCPHARGYHDEGKRCRGRERTRLRGKGGGREGVGGKGREEKGREGKGRGA